MRTLILLVSLLATSAVLADSGHDTTGEIREAANHFLSQFSETQSRAGYTVEYELGTLDPRLTLAPCSQAISADFNSDPWASSQPTLLVTCTASRPWRIFLPVSLSIKGAVYTAARPLGRGERITALMLTQESGELNNSRRAPVSRIEDLVGKEMTRSINRGTVLTSDLIVEPDAVQRGDHVMIVARSGNYTVRTRGKALASGQQGEQVMVENLSSQRRVRGRVIGPGMVEIPM